MEIFLLSVKLNIINAFDHYGILFGIKSDNELKMGHQCLLLGMLVLQLTSMQGSEYLLPPKIVNF